MRDSDLLFSLASTPGQQDQTDIKRTLYFNLFSWLATGAHGINESAN